MDPAKLVLNIEAAGASEVRAMDRHERNREPDGTSAIDPLRSHLNEVLHGPSGPSAALSAMWAAGVQRPNVQAEKPYLRLVIGASPSYFRDPGQGPGEWNAARLDDFQREVMAWMRGRFGDDLAFASVHLDEDTPHIHALIVPTYERKPRTPGKQKRGETLEQFQARKAAAKAAVGIRTAGRSSHPVLSRKGSFDAMRHSLADHLAPLGIVYGDPLEPDQSPKTTRAWVKEQAGKVVAERAALDVERASLEAERAALGDERLAVAAERAANYSQTREWVERIKVERADLAAKRVELDRERAQVQGLLQRLGGLVQRVEAALEAVLHMGPRVRRVLQDVEVAADERRAAKSARSEIVGLVPRLRSAKSFLGEARRVTLDLRSAPEQSREQRPGSEGGLDSLEGPD